MKALGIEMMVSATTRHLIVTGGRNPQFVFANYLFGHQLVADQLAIEKGIVTDKVAQLALKNVSIEFGTAIMAVINDIFVVRDYHLDAWQHPVVLARILPHYPVIKLC